MARERFVWRELRENDPFRSLVVHGHVGFQRLIGELETTIQLTENERESAIAFARACNQTTRMLFTEGGIVTHGGFIRTPQSPTEYSDLLQQMLALELVLRIPLPSLRRLSGSTIPPVLRELFEQYPEDSKAVVHLIHPDSAVHIGKRGSIYTIRSPRINPAGRRLDLEPFESALGTALSHSPRARREGRTGIATIITQTIGDLYAENGGNNLPPQPLR